MKKSELRQMIREEIRKLNETSAKDEWMFEFEGGGWNTVRAKSKKEAIVKIKKEYGKMKPKYSTVRLAIDHQRDYKMHMMNFD